MLNPPTVPSPARMIARERRLVGEVGAPPSASFLVRLPKTWARSVGVEKGSTVTIAFGLGNVLIVAPPGKSREIDRIIEATGGVL